jgi:hypothetical protein
VRLVRSITCCAFFLATGSLLGQDSQLIKPGPGGRPALVQEEGGNWNIPILVDSEPDTDLFISDQLTLAGIYWDGPGFKKDGKFPTYIYSHYKTDHDCRVHRIPKGHEADQNWLDACAELRYNRRLVIVDTRQKTLTVLHSDLMMSDGRAHPDLVDAHRVVIPWDGKVNPALSKAAQRTTDLLVAELRRHPDIQ